MRTRVLIAAFSLLAWKDVRSQCGITVSAGSYAGCGFGVPGSPYFTPFAWVSIHATGGSPPYTGEVAGQSGTFPVPAGTEVLRDVWFSLTSPPLSQSTAWAVRLTDSQGCATGWITAPHMGPNSASTWQFHDLYNAYTYSVVAADCAAGLYSVNIVDEPTDPGSEVGVQGTYHLYRNGAQLSTGSLLSFFQSGQTVLSGLTGGAYRFIASNVSGSMPGEMYCTQTDSVDFLLPNAGDCGVNFRLRAALDGALPSGTIMTDGLRTADLIPITQPYTALGYTFVGSPTNISITPAMLTVTGNDAIVDWVVVELRSSTTMVVYSKPALLQADGDVIDTDGNTYLNFPVSAGSYFIALRHRNHLGVMTSTTRSLTVDPSSTLIDFRSTASGVYGTAPLVLKGSVHCLWAGDATGNGTIKYTGSANDRDPILIAVGSTTPNNTVPNVYDRRDTNLDGVIKYTGSGNDRDIILTTVGSTTPNTTRTQQLP